MSVLSPSDVVLPASPDPQLRRTFQRFAPMANVGMALADQASISGVRFVTSVLIGRFAGKESLGVYSVSFGFLLIATCIQESLICAPFTLFHHRETSQTRGRYRSSILSHVVGLSILSTLAFLVASFLGTRSGVPSELTAALGALAISTPFVLLREFARRVELARLRISVALLVDILSGALQVLMLFVLIHWERLRTDTAYLAVGASCVLPALAWLFLAFRGDKFCAQSAAHELLRSWRVAKWSFLAQMVGLLHWQGVVWIIVWQLGAGATGVLAAANYVILLLNPLALGVCNYISPLAVNAYFQHGLGRVRSLIAMAMAAMGVIIATFSVAVYFYSDLILTGLFTSSDYQGYGTLMLALGLNMMLGVMHMMNDQGVWAIERPEWLLRSTMIAVGVTLLLSLPMIHQYGLLGGAWSMLIGRFVGLTYQTILFFCTSIEPRVFGEPRRQGGILG